ncbi:MAG: hypothetical protein EXR08_01065 [Alphaproteobacteria bacterium]|nr:hypothetical protein [Alphaproteobacteria bacterium]
MWLWLAALLFVCSGWMQPLAAQTLLGSSRDWDAFVVTEGKTKSCYLRAAPGKSEPAGANRGDVYLFVTHRPASKITNEINIIAGYPYKAGSDASISVGKEKFSLFTENDGAWVEKPAEEGRLIAAMKQADRLVVTGTSQRGTKTTDTYSLAGFSAALKTINKACGVK